MCVARAVYVLPFSVRTRWLHARVRVSAREGYVNVHVRVRVHADLSVPVHSRLISYLLATVCPMERMCVILEEVNTQSTRVTTTAVHVECTDYNA